jgi:hypothetical protein
LRAEPLNQAAAARHQRTVQRAERALRALDQEGAEISFQSVARCAGVSRQWLYTQPALRSEIERLRDRPLAEVGGIPARQRATEASLRQQLKTLRVENQRLREDNAGLKAELTLPTVSSAKPAAADTHRDDPPLGRHSRLEAGAIPDARRHQR